MEAETTVMQVSGIFKGPGGREKDNSQIPQGLGSFFFANAQGCPGWMVRVGIERDITLLYPSLTYNKNFWQQ